MVADVLVQVAHFGIYNWKHVRDVDYGLSGCWDAF